MATEVLQRSKSAESARMMPTVDTQYELTTPSLQRLNAVLEVGFAGSAPQPMMSQAVVPTGECQETYRGSAARWLDGPSSGDLLALRGMLGRALAEQSTLINQQASQRLSNESMPSYRAICAASNGSVGTMATSSTMATSRSMSLLVSDSDDDMIRRGVADQTRAKVQRKATPTGHAGGACGQGWGGRSQTSLPSGHSLADAPDDDSSPSTAPTTMMLRNIPRGYTQQDLMLDLEALGFAGTFDFLYIPIDKSTSACMGYAFVNFKNSDSAARCMQSFHDYCFNRQQRGSSKVANVSVARIQGLKNNMRHYKSSTVRGSKHKMHCPVLLASTPTD